MSLYERLGVSKDADPQDIRRAYLKLSKTEHPDKGGSEEKFKSLQKAYEVLSDQNKRAFYDQTGHEDQESMQQQSGMGGGGMPFPFPFDIGSMFGNMFHGGGGPQPFGGGRPRQSKQQKAPPKVHEIGLTLRDFYYGKKFQLKFERQKFCKQCNGEGAERFETCNNCRGAGYKETQVMFGPGMAAVTRGPCGPCSGNGKQPASPCSKCNGTKFTSHEKVLNIVIEPGMSSGEVMKFPNECSDQHEYEEPGDVHIVVQEVDEHNQLARMGDDLSTVAAITFTEAILGTKCTIHGHPAHPAGLVVDIPKGTLLGDTVLINGEGMLRKGTTQRGNLQITVSVSISAAEKEILSTHHDKLVSIFKP